MNVRIFWVRAMKYTCAQTRPRFILSSERVFFCVCVFVCFLVCCCFFCVCVCVFLFFFWGGGGGDGVWTRANSKGKILSTGKFPQRRIEPATLWTASPNTTNELFRPPDCWPLVVSDTVSASLSVCLFILSESGMAKRSTEICSSPCSQTQCRATRLSWHPISVFTFWVREYVSMTQWCLCHSGMPGTVRHVHSFYATVRLQIVTVGTVSLLVAPQSFHRDATRAWQNFLNFPRDDFWPLHSTKILGSSDFRMGRTDFPISGNLASLLPPYLMVSPSQIRLWWLNHLCRSWCHVACCWLLWALDFVLLHWFLCWDIHGNACTDFLAAS